MTMVRSARASRRFSTTSCSSLGCSSTVCSVTISGRPVAPISSRMCAAGGSAENADIHAAARSPRLRSPRSARRPRDRRRAMSASMVRIVGRIEDRRTRHPSHNGRLSSPDSAGAAHRRHGWCRSPARTCAGSALPISARWRKGRRRRSAAASPIGHRIRSQTSRLDFQNMEWIRDSDRCPLTNELEGQRFPSSPRVPNFPQCSNLRTSRQVANVLFAACTINNRLNL